MRAIRLVSLILCIVMLSALFSTVAMAYSKPYYITVDLDNNIVTVYSALDDSIVRQMICSGGTGKYQSPTGTFYMTEKRREAERDEWYTFEDGYGKYGSRIVGSYLFHSYLFTEKDDSKVDWETYAAMGTSASHGCIRLWIEDAYWISQNCMPGTKVTLYHGEARNEYLKELLYVQTFSIDNGISYEEFTAMAEEPGEMGWTSEGDDVKALQERMIELGLYAGEANGYYGALMVNSVKSIQSVLGLRPTGVVDESLLEILNSDESPSSTISTLTEGMSGPAVTSLQQMLAALGLYEGACSGEYDSDTVEAVKAFQRALDYEEDGIATAALQQDMLDSFSYLERTYGDTGYALTYEEQTYETATINASKRLNMRAKRSTDSTIVKRLDPGTEVEIIEHDGGWSKIRCGEAEGYVKTSYLDIKENTKLVPRYVAADAQNPALPELEYGEKVIRTREVAYGTVITEDRLWLRESPDSDAEVVFMLSSGNIAEIVSINDGWAYVSYGEKNGFTQAKYFDIQYTAELGTSYVTSGSLISEDEADKADANMALVVAETGTELMSMASENGDIVDTLAFGEKAGIVFESTNWTQVRTDDGMTGYVRNDVILTGLESDLDAYFAELTAPKFVTAYVNTGSDVTLNMRKEPSSEGEILCELANGCELDVYEDDGEWAQVEFGTYSGYVMSKFISYDAVTE